MAITNTSQLNTFSIIRDIIRTNSTLGAKFAVSDFYEFEPRHKASSFGGFPYFIIMIPDVSNADEFLGDIVKNKEFDVEIILRMDYLARDNYSSYASNLLTVIDSSNSTFESNGYNLVRIESDGQPVAQVMDQKQIVEGRFTLTLQGEVAV